jgi:DNA-binding PadR family transcriptional regulator
MLASPDLTLGRHLEPALWVLIALDAGPLGLADLLDAVRSLDGPMGHGTLIGTISRLERLHLVEAAQAEATAATEARRPAYRLSRLGRVAAGSADILKGRPS